MNRKRFADLSFLFRTKQFDSSSLSHPPCPSSSYLVESGPPSEENSPSTSSSSLRPNFTSHSGCPEQCQTCSLSPSVRFFSLCRLPESTNILLTYSTSRCWLTDSPANSRPDKNDPKTPSLRFRSSHVRNRHLSTRIGGSSRSSRSRTTRARDSKLRTSRFDGTRFSSN